METGKIVLGTLAGIAIGAVVGVLMAPDKGSETRKKISQKGSGYADGLKTKYEGLKDKYNELVDGVTDKLESFTGDSNGSGMNTSQTKGASTNAGVGASR